MSDPPPPQQPGAAPPPHAAAPASPPVTNGSGNEPFETSFNDGVETTVANVVATRLQQDTGIPATVVRPWIKKAVAFIIAIIMTAIGLGISAVVHNYIGTPAPQASTSQRVAVTYTPVPPRL